MSVKDGGVGSIMCSYNRVGGVYACENPYALTTVLRGQWKFQGYVQSDFGATHSTAASLNAGEDLEMQSGRFYTPEAIKKALELTDSLGLNASASYRRTYTIHLFGTFTYQF
jgi:beta-glucosidase